MWFRFPGTSTHPFPCPWPDMSWPQETIHYLWILTIHISKSFCSPGVEQERGNCRDMASLEVSEEHNKENLPAFVIPETILAQKNKHSLVWSILSPISYFFHTDCWTYQCLLRTAISAITSASLCWGQELKGALQSTARAHWVSPIVPVTHGPVPSSNQSPRLREEAEWMLLTQLPFSKTHGLCSMGTNIYVHIQRTRKKFVLFWD